MEDMQSQLAALTRLVTDLQKTVLELKEEVSALRAQNAASAAARCPIVRL